MDGLLWAQKYETRAGGAGFVSWQYDARQYAMPYLFANRVQEVLLKI